MNSLLVDETTTLYFGAGRAALDEATGAPLQFTHSGDERREYLLTRRLSSHTPDHSWGSGQIITDAGAARWQTPDELQFTDGAVSATYRMPVGLTLIVARTGGDTLRERYSFRNDTDHDIVIRSAGIQTPFADVYSDSESALAEAVNAHVFTAGAWAWAYAQPMSGDGAILGLTLTEGALWSYGIESRNPNTSSNFRGHIVLNITDHARAPHAFGGQPQMTVPAGGAFDLGWELRWFGSVEEFIAQTAPPAAFERLAAPVGEEIRVRTRMPLSARSPQIQIIDEDDAAASDGWRTVRLRATAPGSHWIEIGDSSRTEVLFHRPVEEIVRGRIDYILANQRPIERPGTLRSAFVPVDRRTGLRSYANGWFDWSDGSERIGMALMMQRAQRRGWTTIEADSALAEWADFAREHLLDATLTPRRGSFLKEDEIRLYDMPWLTLFFIDRHRTHGAVADLDLAAGILRRGFELGIGEYLAIGLPEAVVKTADCLDAAGRGPEANELRRLLVESATHYIASGNRLPFHEVSYEQSMVTPLIELMVFAHRLTGDDVFLAAVRDRLPWLRAFAGPQQHVRLFGVPIRHWDGYWFGLHRQWGDVFPHHWSSLSAAVFARLPQQLRSPETDALVRPILAANLISYFDDGSATCAFVFPATVDGESAHEADPLVNDQDWPLAIWLELNESESVELG
ncbi:hypothetical protein [Microbacterium sp. USHLN186]|uniref:hypothetical protein n=1 Tax=Microbacterium sp. USHLN186 TaxID=3081286 RepID=UPI003015E47D